MEDPLVVLGLILAIVGAFVHRGLLIAGLVLVVVGLLI